MPYCPKCGNKVDDTMSFCPNCGAALKGAKPSQEAASPPSQGREKTEKTEGQEKQAKNENPEQSEKQQKGEYGFFGFLVSGLILVLIGVFAVIYLTKPFSVPGQALVIILVIIGAIIIIGAVYTAIARKRFPPTH